MRDVFAIIGLLTVLSAVLLGILALVDAHEQRRWDTAAQRQQIRREAREWGHKN